MEHLQDLVETEDHAGLLRAIDAMAARRDWDALVVLADKCRAATERGRQLWAVASNIDYRLALEAPALFLEPVLARPVSRFTFGPLTEVAAFAHSWEELAERVPNSQVAAAIAQERILRGEDLTGDSRVASHIYELPAVRAAGEATIEALMPIYRSDGVHVPDPVPPDNVKTATPGAACPVHEAPESVERFGNIWRDHFDVWTTQSGGTVWFAAGVTDDPLSVAAKLATELRYASIEAGDALVRMAWAGSTGAAHGRRPGFAAGRFQAWWTAASLSGAAWPPSPDPDRFVTILEELDWYWWEPVPAIAGWSFGLVVALPDGVATAVLATDQSGRKD